MRGKHAGVEFRDVQQPVQQVAHRRHRGLGLTHDLACGGRTHVVAQLGDKKAERMHGLAQVVAGGGEEARFGLAGEFELPCPFLNLLLQAGIGFLKLPRHAVELIGKGLEFVAGVHVDAMV